MLSWELRGDSPQGRPLFLPCFLRRWLNGSGPLPVHTSGLFEGFFHRGAVFADCAFSFSSDFTTASSVNAAHIARWNGSWSALTDVVGRNGVNGYVYKIAVSSAEVFGDGNFTALTGGTPAANVARFDGTGLLWRSCGSGVNENVLAMAAAGTNVHVGGNFTSAGGTNVSQIAKWDGLELVAPR